MSCSSCFLRQRKKWRKHKKIEFNEFKKNDIKRQLHLLDHLLFPVFASCAVSKKVLRVFSQRCVPSAATHLMISFVGFPSSYLKIGEEHFKNFFFFFSTQKKTAIKIDLNALRVSSIFPFTIFAFSLLLIRKKIDWRERVKLMNILRAWHFHSCYIRQQIFLWWSCIFKFFSSMMSFIVFCALCNLSLKSFYSLEFFFFPVFLFLFERLLDSSSFA